MFGTTLHLHYAYADWAMIRVLDAAERLSPEKLETAGHAGHGSVRETIAHLIGRQLSWFSWFDGSMPPEEAIRFDIDPEQAATLAGLREVWSETNGKALALIEQLSEDELTKEWPLGAPGQESAAVPLWQLMLHVANHGTQHRSEIAAMLSEHGQSPGGLDLLFYLFERNTVNV